MNKSPLHKNGEILGQATAKEISMSGHLHASYIFINQLPHNY